MKVTRRHFYISLRQLLCSLFIFPPFPRHYITSLQNNKTTKQQYNNTTILQYYNTTIQIH